MSSISRWSYTNIATVYPFEGEDSFNGGVSFGEPFLIACTWSGKEDMHRTNDGAEFMVSNTFWSEDPRPKYKDRIAKGDTTALSWDAAESEEIRIAKDYDMSPFGEIDSPDFEYSTSKGVR